jgi:hypothetical protein
MKGQTMINRNIKNVFEIKLLILLSGLILLQSCTTIKLISSYDEVTDRYLTNLQQSVSNFIDTLEQFSGTEKAAFSKHQNTYNVLDQQIKQLEFRVASIPGNEKTIDIVHNIRLNILGSGELSDSTNNSAGGSSLKDLHLLNDQNKNFGPSKAVLEIARRNIDQTISAALTLELAKKTGENPKK